MKILHCADLHVGANRRFPNYLDRYEVAIKEILYLCKVHEVDVLVLCGDILDSSNPRLEEKTLISKLVSHAPCPVALTYGNHEYFGPRYEDSALQWLIQLSNKTPQIKMWNRPSVEFWEGAWWVVVPYGGWSTADFSFIVNHLLDQIPEGEGPIIGLAHELFDGAVTDLGKGFEGRCKFPRVDVDYFCLGDIHVNQKVAPNAWYCGAPLQIKFGDKKKKGVLLVDVGEDPVFIPLKRPLPLVEVNGVPKNWPTGLVKLRCTANQLPARLPDNVVDTITIPNPDEETELSTQLDSNVLSGMREFLRSKLEERDWKRGLRFAKDLVKENM